MKAKKKPIEQLFAKDLGVDIANRIQQIKVEEPPKRKGGVKVANVAELVSKLKNEAKVNLMSILLIAEHNNSRLKVFTLNAINAASKIDSDIHVLVAGNKCENVSKEVALIPLVKKVLQSESANYENYLAENLTPLVVKLAEGYTHIVASADTFGKKFYAQSSSFIRYFSNK